MKKDYDFVIIGSGFGGSVSALRLAEKGYSVLVIEKGKRYEKDDFAKTNWNIKRWLWLPFLKCYGIMKMSFYRHITIISGVGVGGGSLVYANTLPKPEKAFFNQGSWANLADWEKELEPHYETCWKMLGATENPKLGAADLALKKLAGQLGKEKDFSPTKVAVYFGKPDETVPDPYFNGKGPYRSSCAFCGGCMTGCRHNAKNSLDKNYLYLAEKLGVTVLAEHKAVDVLPVGNEGENGYEIVFRKSTSFFPEKKVVKTKGVIFSAGVLGTVPLLLKLKNGNLKNLSHKVGDMIMTNNEALILNTTYRKNSPDYSEGIAIGSILKVDENSHVEPVRYGNGSGFWRVSMTPMISESRPLLRLAKFVVTPFADLKNWIKVWFTPDFAKHTPILLFMQHIESTLKFRKGLLRMKTKIEQGKAPTAFIPEAHNFAKMFSELIGAKPQVIFTESISGIPSTAHILGGACMGKTKNEGVIDPKNRVFGYKNMYVFDGSMISANPGVNPSLSIAAITERGMSFIPPKKDFEK